MLSANRRLALVYVCLAGMDIAWFTLLLLFFYRTAWVRSPWPIYGGLLAALLTWMLAIDFLGAREIKSPRYELAVAGLIVLSSLALIRLLLYGSRPLTDISWLLSAVGGLFDFRTGMRPEWGFIGVNLFLWQRATSATRREMSFFGVGLSFRLGMLLLIFAAGIYGQYSGQNLTPFLYVYFGMGLTAVAIARIHEKALGSRSSGIVLPGRRLVQLLVAVGATVGATAGLSSYYTPQGIKKAIGWFQPLWDLLATILLWMLQVVLWLLTPLFMWLEAHIRQLDVRPIAEALRGLQQAVSTQPTRDSSATFALPAWIVVALRDIAVVLVLALAIVVILSYLDRTRRLRLLDESEQEATEQITLGGDLLGRGVRRLRNLVGMARRFGLSSQLLAAVSVQNIYANLCRLARQRGQPRRPAQPPDDYLTTLVEAFGGQQDALARITAAYMQVHYGERPVSSAELSQVRADYEQVRDTISHK